MQGSHESGYCCGPNYLLHSQHQEQEEEAGGGVEVGGGGVAAGGEEEAGAAVKLQTIGSMNRASFVPRSKRPIIMSSGSPRC